jgi:hypothetical protein
VGKRSRFKTFELVLYGPFTDTVHRVRDVLMSTSPVTVHFITQGKTNMESRMAEMQTSFEAQRNKHPLQQ